MRAALVLGVVALVVVGGGCRQASRSSVELKLAGSTFHLRYGRAIAEKDQLVVELSDNEVACSQRDVPGDAPRLSLTLPPGPDGHFFAGKATGYPTKVSQGKTAVDVPHQLRTATVEPFKAKAGQRLRGQVDFDAKVGGKPVSAHGKLDVLVCSAPTLHKNFAPETRVLGRYADQPQIFHSAAVELVTGADGKPFIDGIVFSTRPRHSCFEGVGDDSFVLDVHDIGGTAGGMPPKGQPLPAVASARSGKTPMLGWVAFDQGSLRLGGRITGKLAVSSDRDSRFGGHFAARVCPEHPSSRMPATSNVTLSVNGKQRKLAYGRASLRLDGIWIKLAHSGEIGCSAVGSAFGPTHPDGAAVSFLVPMGPGRKFYAGHKVGVTLEIGSPSFRGENAKNPVESRRDQAEVELKPVDPKEFSRIRGHIHSSFKVVSGEGSVTAEPVAIDGDFDVELCTPVRNALWFNSPLPGDAPAHPASGVWGSEPFHVKSALAFVSHDPVNGTDFIQSVAFFGHPGAGCTSKSLALHLDSPGGAGSRSPLLGSPQPVDIALPHDSGWLRFDKLDFKPGGQAKGSFVVSSGTDAEPRTAIAGQFVAKVCRSR